MTQEEKAKAYDKAIEIAKGIHSFSSNIAEIKRMEQIFPELKESKESEDERIRKMIINTLNRAKILTEDEAYDCVAWLKKQGEQKPKWTEEDEELYQYALNVLEAFDYNFEPSEGFEKLYDWLTSLKQRMEEQQ